MLKSHDSMPFKNHEPTGACEQERSPWFPWNGWSPMARALGKSQGSGLPPWPSVKRSVLMVAAEKAMENPVGI